MVALRRAKEFLRKLLRKKRFDYEDTPLARILSTLDLTLLGIGSTMGVGIYVLAGEVSRLKAGPAIVVSFLCASVAAIFSGLCYAELGAQVPKAGSAFVYSYVTIGEFMAFSIGWNLVLEYMIGTASVAKAFSGYLDFLSGGALSEGLNRFLPIGLPYLSKEFDVPAFFVQFGVAVLLSSGVRESSFANNVLTTVNIGVVSYVIIVGSWKADIHNWMWKKEEIPPEVLHAGDGGFFPFGTNGVLRGAAACFFAFVGFDCIATTGRKGEETLDPQRSIPISIVLSLLFISASYIGMSTVINLMWPYFDQSVSAPLIYIFDKVGWPVAKWVVSVGICVGMSSSMLGALFPLPRLLYAMSTEGLLFRMFSDVSPRFKTPVKGTMFSGVMSGLLAATLDLDQLVDMLSIGTLTAYTMVAISIMILRYQAEPEATEVSAGSLGCWGQLTNRARSASPTTLSSRISLWFIWTLVVLIFVLVLLVTFLQQQIFSDQEPGLIVVVVLLLAAVLLVSSLLRMQPMQSRTKGFKMPLVPELPILSLFINMLLMLQLSGIVWARFGIWLILGTLVYFLYGIRYSKVEAENAGDLTLIGRPNPGFELETAEKSAALQAGDAS